MYVVLLLLASAAGVASAAKLVIDEGVVVKFGTSAGLTVRDGLQTSRHVTMSSVRDDAVGGQTGPSPGVPAAGDWRGVLIEDWVLPANLQLDRLAIRYAGSDNAAALQLAQNVAIQFLDIAQSLLGVRVVAGAHVTLTGLSLLGNAVGLEASENALPTLSGSEIVGNTDFGVLNLAPAKVTQASGTWWGAATGPTDPVANPGGSGDKVSAGVNYSQFATSIPLIDCSIAPKDGNYTVSTPVVTLALECRNAIEYRLASTSDFDSLPFQPMTLQADFALSGSTGAKPVYVQYRAQTGNAVVVALSPSINYTPGTPVVTIVAPAENAVVTTDTTISAQASDAAGIDHVSFYVDATLIGTDASAPYEVNWPIAAFANGSHLIKVVATSVSAQTGEATRAITVQQQVRDTQGPSISDVLLDGETLTQGMTLTASGTITLTVVDPSSVDSVSVALDGAVLPGGVLLDNHYTVGLNLAGVANGAHVIALAAADGLGNPSAQSINVVVDVATQTAPVVTITAPAAGAVITAYTTIAATATDVAGVTSVVFYVDTTLLDTLTTEPYELTWPIAGYANGAHTIRVVATNALLETGEATRAVTIQRASNDTNGPALSAPTYAGQPLTAGMTLAAPGLLTFEAVDPSGVASAGVLVDGAAVAGGGLNGSQYSVLLDFAAVANGAHTITLQATDTVGNPSEVAIAVDVEIPPPAVPSILVPADGSTVQQPHIAVSGTAQPGSSIQLYVDGAAAGGLVPTGFNGTFSSAVTLAGEGTHQLSATAQNSRGTSIRIDPALFITYSAAAPTVLITSPPEGAVVTDDVDVSASIIDGVGISSAVFSVDGALVGAALTDAPYSWHWLTGSVSDGSHTLGVAATNLVGKSTTVARHVVVQHAPPPPPPVQTAYTGQVQSISPAAPTYGEQPITISGRAIDRTTDDPVPNALLKLVLRVNGFQRRIGMSSDATGAFVFSFHPQASDAGIYIVSVIHPEQTELPNQGSFTINRLGLNPTSLHLQAARTVSSTLRIIASTSAGAGAGIGGVHLQFNSVDQPSGSLPPGISIAMPGPVNIPAGASVPIDVQFTGDESAAASGTLVLTAYAADSSGATRGLIRIDYTLSAPQPALFPQPSAIQTGVSQGQQVSASVQLSNKGLLAATDVQVQLVDANGSPTGVPDWIHLASPAQVGTIAVGASQTIQIVASPSTNVMDGIYNVKLRVTAANTTAGDIWASVAVTQAGTGGVMFRALDIYTNTCVLDPATQQCDAGGAHIPGLAGAAIRVQNEAVYTITRSGVTHSNGQLEMDDLPTGQYLYTATAPSHVAASGRFTIRPGITFAQDAFLDYALVTFEWTVTETTIQDHYDVTLQATYQTQVPAPVVLIEPPSINLPDMQVGEEFNGEISITNYGLVRADNVTWQRAQSDSYFRYEYLGEVPNSLAAHQRVTLAYKVTALSPLPGAPLALLARGVLKARASGQSSGTCYGYSVPMRVEFSYQCAAGIEVQGSANAGFNKAYGQCSGGTPGVWVGGGGGGGAGGWGGGGPGGTPMSSGPGCAPVCPDCQGGGPGG